MQIKLSNKDRSDMFVCMYGLLQLRRFLHLNDSIF